MDEKPVVSAQGSYVNRSAVQMPRGKLCCGTGWSKYVRPQRPMWMSFSAVNIMPLGREDIAQVMLEILTRSSWHEYESPGTLLLRTPGRVEN